MMNLENIRKDFPILQTKVGEEPLIYFTNLHLSKEGRTGKITLSGKGRLLKK